MSRKKGIPADCLHKASGRGVARVDGHDYYFGPYEDLESHERYRRFIAEWLVDRGRSTSSANEKRLVSINEVLLVYWEFAQPCYATNGSPSSELSCMRCALRPVRELYGHSRADEFGSKSLRAVQQLMIDHGLSRRTINGRVAGFSFPVHPPMLRHATGYKLANDGHDLRDSTLPGSQEHSAHGSLHAAVCRELPRFLERLNRDASLAVRCGRILSFPAKALLPKRGL